MRQYQVCSSSSSLDKPSISSSSPPIARQNCIAIYNIVMKYFLLHLLFHEQQCKHYQTCTFYTWLHQWKEPFTIKVFSNITQTFSAYCFLCSAGMDSARSAKPNWTVHLPLAYVLINFSERLRLTGTYL